jgi:hypothetical protein
MSWNWAVEFVMALHHNVVQMAKTEVYSWRVEADTKAELQRAARRANQSMGSLLGRIVREWLAATGASSADAAEQQRLHQIASKFIGTLRGGNPHRAEEARSAVRARLLAKHARQRPH